MRNVPAMTRRPIDARLLLLRDAVGDDRCGGDASERAEHGSAIARDGAGWKRDHSDRNSCSEQSRRDTQ
ncbi:hypothetical protein [Rhodopseudomonas palustris]|uniref:hypothetical protein n=1 Tax=Rhodopseudomonas palustris TaxID=1076 RepID=UPI0021F3C1FD|nr:hypothetical protein [Rhodopseudomonas palustris]UYO51564.1 hypothetical protein KQX61_13070 [Rhodopseudomonas palustris]